MFVEEEVTDLAIYFITITNDMQMTDGFYPGSYGRTCEITSVKQKSNNAITAVLYYPAIEPDDVEDAMPEMEIAVTFASSDGFSYSLEIIYENGAVHKFSFIAEDFEQATKVFDPIMEERYQNSLENNIPKIATSSTVIDADFETLRIRMGSDLYGPHDSWRSNAKSIFYLNNIDEVDCYMNRSSGNELIGVKDG